MAGYAELVACEFVLGRVLFTLHTRPTTLVIRLFVNGLFVTRMVQPCLT